MKNSLIILGLIITISCLANNPKTVVWSTYYQIKWINNDSTVTGIIPNIGHIGYFTGDTIAVLDSINFENYN